MNPIKFITINKQCSDYCSVLYNQVKERIFHTELTISRCSGKHSFKVILENSDVGIMVSIPYDINQNCDKFGFKIETNLIDINDVIVYDKFNYSQDLHWVEIDELMWEIMRVCILRTTLNLV
jgi:hypothetical protein